MTGLILNSSVVHKKMRQYALVELTDDYKKAMEGRKDSPIMNEKIFIFFGEIPNMPGHCVVSGHESGKIYSGYHIDSFQELQEEGY